MVLGLVPVTVAYGGPAELVTDLTGYRVPIGSRAQIIKDFRAVLEHIVQDPNSIRPMGERARQRVLANFTWEAKATQIFEVYRWALGKRSDKPDFGMPLKDTYNNE